MVLFLIFKYHASLGKLSTLSHDHIILESLPSREHCSWPWAPYSCGWFSEKSLLVADALMVQNSDELASYRPANVCWHILTRP